MSINVVRTQQRCDRFGQCGDISIISDDTILNTKLRDKSSLIVNAKDEYGFRKPSPFSASEVIVENKNIPIDIIGTQVDPPGWTTSKQSWTGLPFSISRFEETLKMTTGGEQSDDLLAMRAESGMAQSDINVLQFAAFLPSTLKNIYQNIRKLDELLDLLHNPAALKKRLGREDPRSLYLEFLFVWNQLYRDIVGGLNFIRSKARPIGSLMTGRSHNKSVVPYFREYNTSPSPPSWARGYGGRMVVSGEVEVSQRAVAVGRVTCDIALSRNALGLTNPAYLAWDLVKWSWVIDQVVDFGLFISSLTSTHGLDHLGTSITTRVINRGVLYPVGTSYSDRIFDWKIDVGEGFSTSHRKSINRVVRGSPTNVVTYRNPFQSNVMILAAAFAALSLKMKRSESAYGRLGRS